MTVIQDLDNQTALETFGTCRPAGPSSGLPENLTLIDLFLREQQQVSAVEQFSHAHEAGVPAQAKFYSKLLPASPPKEGEQYAFQVDLDRCSGCKACVTACHSLNGLDEQETWREVGLLIGGETSTPIMQHVTTACHHCVEPGCLIGCPVNAYTKDAVTGIVKHLDDQCIGCQYCTLACPYEVPQFHAEKGIVRKCDMCSDRLAVGEAPACVQACPHEAISIKTVNVDQVRANAETDPFLPGAPPPHVTLPTTTYKSNRVFPRNALPADYHSLRLQHPHWPLILMLVLTQLSVGTFTIAVVCQSVLAGNGFSALLPAQTAVALAFGLAALGASTLHLGRPQYAFRAMLGIRHSWLSREIAAFGAFAGIAAAYTVAVWQPQLAPLGLSSLPSVVSLGLGWLVCVTGLTGVFCSVMIYAFTQRDFWSFPRGTAKFFLTTALLGIATTMTVVLAISTFGENAIAENFVDRMGVVLLGGFIGVSLLKLLMEASLFLHFLNWRQTSLKRTALLSAGPLAQRMLWRFGLGLVGGVGLPWLLIGPIPSSSILATITMLTSLGMCGVGEILERYQFFAAVSPPRMPGNVKP